MIYAVNRLINQSISQSVSQSVSHSIIAICDPPSEKTQFKLPVLFVRLFVCVSLRRTVWLCLPHGGCFLTSRIKFSSKHGYVFSSVFSFAFAWVLQCTCARKFLSPGLRFPSQVVRPLQRWHAMHGTESVVCVQGLLWKWSLWRWCGWAGRCKSLC